jgi:hypothetical protein
MAPLFSITAGGKEQVAPKFLSYKLVALAFSVLFCASSIQVYRGQRTEDEARRAAAETLGSLPRTSWAGGRFQVVHIATHGYFSTEDVRADRLTNDYNNEISILAHEFAHVAKSDKQAAVTLTYAKTDALVLQAQLNNAQDNFFYDRLLLEKRLQEGRLSQGEYQKELRQILEAYADGLPESELACDKDSYRAQLGVAERQIAQMRTEVNSLKDQLARAERPAFETWAPLIIAILSFLIAVSSHVISWRADRRQSREAALLPLKREELEKNIALKDRQISEGSGRIITPSPRELQLYSGALSVDHLERIK